MSEQTNDAMCGCGCPMNFDVDKHEWKCPHCGHVEIDHGEHPDRDEDGGVAP